MKRDAVRRILEARARSQAKALAARVPVLRHQLSAMRGTYPA